MIKSNTSKTKIYTKPKTANNWNIEQVQALFDKPVGDLMAESHAVHCQNFDANEIQASTLLNIKTGKCPENCSYCPQSVHYDTDLKSEPLMEVNKVVDAAKQAKQLGATRFCMGAAWRSPKSKDLATVITMVKEVKSLGLETCATLGMLDADQAEELKQAGLDYYNHNIDTSEDNYNNIISTRTFADRMDTINHVQEQDIKVCAGGIIGMGETVLDRAKMLMALANMAKQPESVPINQLIPIPGTPLAKAQKVSVFDFVKVVAVARILMPATFVRLSAGREDMTDELQFLCFFAGANSIFYGNKLLTADNKQPNDDLRLLNDLGMRLATYNSK